MSNARGRDTDGSGDRALTPEERERLQDLVRLQPTKNSELQSAWGMASGSEVHGYLEEHLGDLYYRDDDSLIRATAAAVELVGGDPSQSKTPVTDLEAAIIEVLPGPAERSQSVVATLHDLREADTGPADLDADTVRRALRSLAGKGIVEVVQRTVPTFRLARERNVLELEID